MYATLAAAVTAVNAASPAPSNTNRAIILVHPGYYTMTATVTIPSYTGIVGVNKGLVQFFNSTTDMFTCSDHCWFENFLIEGCNDNNRWAFIGNDADAIHIRSVDMLNNGGTARQRFLRQTGANWIVMFIEQCVVDYRGLSNYAVELENTSGAARIVDTNINDCFFDAYDLTGFGGSFVLRAVRDVRFKRTTIRGAATWNTGIRLELFGSSGQPTCEIRQCDMANLENSAGGVSVYNDAGTRVFMSNTEAPGCAFSGLTTLRNSFTT